jgi:hypothetical protein
MSVVDASSKALIACIPRLVCSNILPTIAKTISPSDTLEGTKCRLSVNCAISWRKGIGVIAIKQRWRCSLTLAAIALVYLSVSATSTCRFIHTSTILAHCIHMLAMAHRLMTGTCQSQCTSLMPAPRLTGPLLFLLAVACLISLESSHARFLPPTPRRAFWMHH